MRGMHQSLWSLLVCATTIGCTPTDTGPKTTAILDGNGDEICDAVPDSDPETGTMWCAELLCEETEDFTVVCVPTDERKARRQKVRELIESLKESGEFDKAVEKLRQELANRDNKEER